MGTSLKALEVQKAVEIFINHCKDYKRLSQNTIRSYRRNLNQFSVRCKADNKKLSGIDRGYLKQYILDIKLNYAPKSAYQKYATLSSYFNYLKAEGILKANPIDGLKFGERLPVVLPEHLTLREMKAMFDYAYFKKNEYSKQCSLQYYRTGLLWVTILEILFATGIRACELCSLKTKDVNLHEGEGEIRVTGKRNRERIVPITNSQTLNTLREYMGFAKPEKEGYFFVNRFGGPFKYRAVRRAINGISKESLGRTVSPHTIRHTYATLLLEQGVDVVYIQSLLGHSAISTTMIYTHITDRRKRSVLESSHPRNKIKTKNVTIRNERSQGGEK